MPHCSESFRRHCSRKFLGLQLSAQSLKCGRLLDLCICLDFNSKIIKFVENRARTNHEVRGYGWLATAHVKQGVCDTGWSSCRANECLKYVEWDMYSV